MIWRSSSDFAGTLVGDMLFNTNEILSCVASGGACTSCGPPACISVSIDDCAPKPPVPPPTSAAAIVLSCVV